MQFKVYCRLHSKPSTMVWSPYLNLRHVVDTAELCNFITMATSVGARRQVWITLRNSLTRKASTLEQVETSLFKLSYSQFC